MGVVATLGHMIGSRISGSPPYRVFISSVEVDRAWREKLCTHLQPLQRRRLIDVFDESKVTPGDDRLAAIREELSRAVVILLLVSPDYFASDEHCDIHMPLALARRDHAHVIPIPLSPCGWKNEPIGALQQLPRSGQYVALDETGKVLAEIAEELRVLLEGEGRSVDKRERSELFAAGREDLLARVERVCLLKGAKGARRMRGPSPFDAFLDVTTEDGDLIQQHPIVAIEQGVDEALVRQLVDGLRRQYPPDGPQPVMVYGGPRADSAVVQFAKRARVQLQHFDDYARLIDFSEYLRRQTARLEADPIYPPPLYVGQTADLLDPVTGYSPDVLTSVEDWLRRDGARFVLLLGDFGTGKSFLLHELARRLGSGTNPSLVPVLVEMRQLEKQQKLEALVAAHFMNAGLGRFDWPAFRYMLESGRIALLFDGFDELAFRVKYDRAVEHFDTLLQAAREGAKLVVTSRSQHFRSTNQVRTALGERAWSQRGYVMAVLRPFEPAQIREFLRNKLKSSAEADARFALIEEVKDLLGLSKNPRMLGFIADLPENKLRAAGKDGEISAAGLYQVLLERWLGHEHERAHPHGAPQGLSVEDRWKAVTTLALLLWERTDPCVTLAELPDATARAITDLAQRSLDPDVASHHVGSGTLLTRDESEQFRFFHQSIMEWLIAREAAREVLETGASMLLATQAISELMAQFFGSLAGREVANKWAQAQITATDSPAAAKTNGRLVLKWLGIEIQERANFVGQDLRGQDLSGRDLRRADFTGADLTDALLQEANLAQARLSGATLVRANFTRANLSGADLRGADASWARFTGANLDGAIVLETKLERAALMGVKWGERAPAPSVSLASLPHTRHPEVQFFAGSSCNAVAFSPDGALLASGHDDGCVRIWAAANGVLLRTLLAHSGMVQCVVFSPDGKYIASGSADNSIRLWDPCQDQPLRTLLGHSDPVCGVAFSPDGRRLASCSDDCSIRLWDPNRDQPQLRMLQCHSYSVLCLAFSPDGKCLASGSADHSIRLWDPDCDQPPRTLRGHSDTVWSVAFSPDGTCLASGSDDSSIRIWDYGSGHLLQALRNHSGPVWSLAFSPDGKHLASGADDNSICVWDLERQQPLRYFQGHSSAVWCIAYNPDGKGIASVADDNSIRLWDTKRDQPAWVIKCSSNSIWSVAFGAKGKYLVSGSDNQLIRFWNFDRDELQWTFQYDHVRILSLAFSPDEKRVATGFDDSSIHLWDLEDKQSHILRGHSSSVLCISFSPDGKYLASGSGDHSVRLWDPNRDQFQRVLQGHSDSVLCVAFSPDGRRIASGSSDHSMRLWDPDRKWSLRTFRSHSAPVWSIAFGPDGQHLASGSGDAAVRLWASDRDQPLRTFRRHSNSVFCVTFSPDGKRIASGSGDNTICVWALDSDQPLLNLYGHTLSVVSLAFSPDGNRLASASQDNTIRIWNVETGTCLYTILYTPEGWAAFTPDGRYKYEGDAHRYFWHLIGLTRYEPGELDPYWPTPLRVGEGERLAPP